MSPEHVLAPAFQVRPFHRIGVMIARSYVLFSLARKYERITSKFWCGAISIIAAASFLTGSVTPPEKKMTFRRYKFALGVISLKWRIRLFEIAVRARHNMRQ